MERRRDREDEPALTEELRHIMHPRTGWLLAVLVLITLVLWGLLIVASHTPLARLWH
jgi:hypothetical protein